MAADEAICPHCDHIIDTSFLEADAEPSAAPPRRPAAGRPPPPRRPTGARSSPKSAPGARASPPRGSTARRSAPAPSRYGAPEYDPDLDGPLEDGPAARAFPAAERQERHLTGKIMAPDEALRDFANFFHALGSSDRIAFFGALAVTFSCFFPWKSTLADGDVLGLLSLGVVALIATGIHMGAIAIRVQRFMPRLHPLIPWLVQLATAAFALLWILIYLRISWDSTEVPSPIGNYTMMRSSPSFGAWLALVGAGVSLTGTLLGLREKAG